MKPIPLTEKQKEKLLEMCKKLFPNKKIRWSLAMHNLLFIADTNTYMGYNIHWFEFCMTYIADAVTYKMCKDEGADARWQEQQSYYRKFLDDCIRFRMTYNPPNRIHPHPVDYIYKEFKKLK